MLKKLLITCILMAGFQVSAQVASFNRSSIAFDKWGVGTRSEMEPEPPVLLSSSRPTLTTVTNTGSTALTFGNVNVTGDYSYTTNCPTSLPAGGKCTFFVTFSPTALGSRSGTLTIATNDPASPHVIGLAGTGVAAYQVAVTKTGSGNSTVRSIPTGIDCGSNCSSLFTGDGTTDGERFVATIPSSSFGHAFSGWGGDCNGSLVCKRMSFTADLNVVAVTNTVPATVAIPMVASGTSYSLALKSDGYLVGWGANIGFNLGVPQFRAGGLDEIPVPMDIQGVSGVVSIAAGQGHTLAVKSDQTLLSWGSNSDGQLGDSSFPLICSGIACGRYTPTVIPTLSGVVASAASWYHSLALKSDGSVWAWGQNLLGQLGDTTTTQRRDPVQVNGIANAIAIAAGPYHSIALKDDGTVWGWGRIDMQLGVDPFSTAYSTSAVQIPGLTQVVAIAAGSGMSVALRSDGTVWTVGSNTGAQLGVGHRENSAVPLQVPGLSDIVHVATFNGHMYAVKKDGTLYEWGTTPYGTGLNPNEPSTWVLSPRIISNLPSVGHVAPGGYHSVIYKNDGALSSWGANYLGELGQGHYFDTTEPGDVVSNLNIGNPLPLLGISSTTGAFAARAIATSSVAQTFTLTNNGSGFMHIPVVFVTGDFSRTTNCALTLAPGASCTLSVTFTPTAEGVRQGGLSVVIRDKIYTLATLTGTGQAQPAATISNNSLSFANTNLSTDSATQRITLTNTGSRVLDTTAITASGDFSYSTTCTSSLAVNDSCTFDVGFTPTATGARTGSLSIYTTALSSPTQINLSGTGISASGLQLNPTTLTFSTQSVGTASASQTVTITNVGNGPVSLQSFNHGPHFFSSTTCLDPLAAGASCTLTIQYTPTVAGSHSAWLTIGSNASNAPHRIALQGQAPADRVPTCTLRASPSTVVSGAYTNLIASCTPAATSYSWTGAGCSANTTSNCQISPSSTTTYTVTGTNSIGTGTTVSTKVIVDPQTLSVSVYGFGRVTSSPSGIDCTAGCSAVFSQGDTVTLTALANAGQNFTGWSGACTGTSSCVVSMSMARQVTANFSVSVTPAIAVGSGFTSVLKSDGTVMVWGRNISTQLGLDWYQFGNNFITTPTPQTAVNGVVQLSSSLNHTLALRADRTVMAWGYNQAGALGDGTTQPRLQPVQVPGLRDVIAISAGPYHSMVLQADGTVMAWGDNSAGQLGDTTTTNRITPVKVQNLDQVRSLAAGYMISAAIRDDGSLLTWGDNSSGQFGVSSSSQASSAIPVVVPGVSQAVAVSIGYGYTLVLRQDGTVLSWGINYSGQLGTGDTNRRFTPGVIPNLTDIVAIHANQYTNYALKRDGTLYAWGDNSSGQVGDGTTTNRLSPVVVTGLSNVRQIAASGHAIAMLADGSLAAWGSNGSGPFGNGGTTDSTTPVVAGSNLNVGSSSSKLTPNTGTLSFASLPAGATSTSQPITLTNNGSAFLYVPQLFTTGDFNKTSGNCGLVLEANASCTVNISFAPASTGTRTGTLSAVDQNNVLILTSLSGTASVSTPDAPSITSIAAANGSLNVAFSAPSSAGASAIDNYRVTCTGGITTSGTGSPLTVSGLSNGTTYTCTVAAHNFYGWGPESTVSNAVTPKYPQTISLGSAPSLTVGSSASLSATAGSGLPVTFTVSSSSLAVCSVAGTTVTGLGVGQCTLYVDQAGNGSYSAASRSYLSFSVRAGATGAPGSPEIQSVQNMPGQARISFLVPAYNGGAPILGYTVTCTANGYPTRSASGTTSPITVRGMLSAVSYNCTLTANNGDYTSSASGVTPVLLSKDLDLAPILMLLLEDD